MDNVTAVQARIITVLGKKPATPAQIGAECGFDGKWALPKLRRLLEKGYVVRKSGGRYELRSARAS